MGRIFGAPEGSRNGQEGAGIIDLVPGMLRVPIFAPEGALGSGH